MLINKKMNVIWHKAVTNKLEPAAEPFIWDTIRAESWFFREITLKK